MKKLLTLTAILLSTQIFAQKDSLQRNGIWYYCSQSKTDAVRNFYPNKNDTIVLRYINMDTIQFLERYNSFKKVSKKIISIPIKAYNIKYEFYRNGKHYKGSVDYKSDHIYDRKEMAAYLNKKLGSNFIADNYNPNF